MPGFKKFASKFSFGKKRDAPQDQVVDIPPGQGGLKRTNAKLRKRNATVIDLNAAEDDDPGVPFHGQQHFSRLFMRSFVSSQNDSRVNSFGPEQHLQELDAETREAARLRRDIMDRRPPTPIGKGPLPEHDGSMVSRLGLKVNLHALEARASLHDCSIGAGARADSHRRLQQALGAKATLHNEDIGVGTEALPSVDRPSVNELEPGSEEDGSMVSRLGLVANLLAFQAAKAEDRGNIDATHDPLCMQAAGLADHGNVDAAPDRHCPLGLPLEGEEGQAVKHSPPTIRRKPVSQATGASEEAVAQRMSWETVRSTDSANSAQHGSASSSPDGKLPAIRDIDWSKLEDDAAKHFAEAYDAVNPWVAIDGVHERLFFEPHRDSGSSGTSPTDSFMTALTNAPPTAYEGKGKARAFDRTPLQLERESEELQRLAEEALLLAEDQFLLAKKEAAEIAVKQTRGLAESHRYDAERRYTIMRAESKMMMAQSARLKQEAQDRQQAILLQEQFLTEQQEAARIADERARLRDCNVCGDAKDPLEFAAKPPSAKCEHPPTTCNDCLEKWMASEFDGKGGEGIKCPECPATLDYADVQRAASPATFEAYDKLLTRLALGSLEDFAWCLAPTCGSGQLNPENRNYMDCKHCGYKQCLRHKVQWHLDETCEQYDHRVSGARAREEEERQTEAMLDGVSKKCPGVGCGWRIQKTEGCDHMTCKKCRWEFCWQCLASQKEIKSVGNTAHEVTCKFHSTNLDVAWPFNVH